MGNEHSKSKAQLNRNGGLPEKQINGPANILSANISSNGTKIAVIGDTTVQQNNKQNLTTESNDFVIVESDCKPDASVISEIVENIIQKEEVKASHEDQTDVSLPATEPQTESTSSGEGAITVIVAVHRENFKSPHRKANISTQTGQDVDDDTTTDIEDPFEEVVTAEAAATEEDHLNDSACVIIEEFVEETANEEPVDNQTAWIINEDVVMESIVYNNIVFRGERVEFNDIKIYDPEEESVNGRDETEPDVAAEPNSNQKEFITDAEIVAEENNIEGTLPLEVFYNLPKVVADCVKLVFADVPQATGFAAVNTAVPIAEEVTAEDDGEGAGDTSVEVVLTEKADPQSNKLAVIEELPGDTLSSLDDVVKPESIPEDRTTDEEAEVGEDAIADVGPERHEETEPSPVFVQNNAEWMLEAAIDALSQDFEPSNLTPEEATLDNGFHLEEEVITATTYVPLSGEQEASLVIPEELVETVTDKTNEAIEASSNDIEAVPESVEEDTTNVVEKPADVPPMDATEEPSPCVSIQEELKDENIAPAEVPTDSNHVVSEEPVEESLSLLKRQPQSNMPMVILQTIEDEVVKEIMHETDHSAIEKNSEDSQIATSDESLSDGVDAVLEAIVKEIITEDVVTAERNFVTSEEVAPEVIVEGESESSVNSTDSQSFTRTATEALAVRLQSACISVVDESATRLGGLILPIQYSITVTIHISSMQEQQ